MGLGTARSSSLGLEARVDHGSAVEKQAQIATAPVEVTTNVLLGASQSVQNVETLQRLGVTHVLNMAGPIAAGPIQAYAQAGIVYLEIDAEDEEGFPLLDRHLVEARRFMERARH